LLDRALGIVGGACGGDVAADDDRSTGPISFIDCGTASKRSWTSTR